MKTSIPVRKVTITEIATFYKKELMMALKCHTGKKFEAAQELFESPVFDRKFAKMIRDVSIDTLLRHERSIRNEIDSVRKTMIEELYTTIKKKPRMAKAF